MNDKELDKIIDYLKNYDGDEVRLMEVCGTHTAAITKSGIPSILSPKIKLISGPGCPVCVTVTAVIDRLVELSLKEKTIVLTFGDLIRVRGTKSSLSDAKALGGHVRMVYSPMDALDFAKVTDENSKLYKAIHEETFMGLVGEGFSENWYTYKSYRAKMVPAEKYDAVVYYYEANPIEPIHY